MCVFNQINCIRQNEYTSFVSYTVIVIDSFILSRVWREGEGASSLEHISLADGGPRVKFASEWKGPLNQVINQSNRNKQHYLKIAQQLSDILCEMEHSHAAPILPDGKVGGNASARITLSGKEYLLVSKSGKYAGQKMILDEDFCLLECFYSEDWKAIYYSADKSILPTSDTPMHHAAMNAHKTVGWPEKPNVILHGHALATEAEAARAGLPCSTTETLFSTPEDTNALLNIMSEFPYPDSYIYIRKGHGFMLLAPNINDAVLLFRNKIVPYM